VWTLNGVCNSKLELHYRFALQAGEFHCNCRLSGYGTVNFVDREGIEPLKVECPPENAAKDVFG
jgi:hypothetical protein